MKHLEDLMSKKLSSTPQQIIDFMSTSVYQDYLLIIDQLIECARDDLEDAGNQHSGKTYDVTRGALKKLRLLREVFILMVEESKADFEEAQNGKS